MNWRPEWACSSGIIGGLKAGGDLFIVRVAVVWTELFYHRKVSGLENRSSVSSNVLLGDRLGDSCHLEVTEQGLESRRCADDVREQWAGLV